MPQRYNLKNLKKVFDRPRLISKEIKRLSYRFSRYPTVRREINKRVIYDSNKYINIMEKDWDNLFILDACRYDIFSQVNSIEGELSKLHSNASHSKEFIKRNFNDNKFYDTIYISANPHASKTLKDGTFYKTVETYPEIKDWSNDTNLHHPENIARIASKEYRKNRNKKIIIHFMSPHTPYYGHTASKVREKLLRTEEVGISRSPESNTTTNDPNEVYRDLLNAAYLREGYITDAQLYECYKEDLKIALKQIKQLLKKFDGKTVVTADHGEMLGNPTTVLPMFQKYRHPERCYTLEVREVPWLEVNTGSRRKIIPETPKNIVDSSEEVIEEQLRSLGYKV